MTTPDRTDAISVEQGDVTLRLAPDVAAQVAVAWKGELQADIEGPPDIKSAKDLEAFIGQLIQRGDLLDALDWGATTEAVTVTLPSRLAYQLVNGMLDEGGGCGRMEYARFEEIRAGFAVLDQLEAIG